MAEHTYLLKLYQVKRSLTDSFTVEAENEEQAREQAAAIATQMGLKDDFDFEVQDLSVKADSGATESQNSSEGNTDNGHQAE